MGNDINITQGVVNPDDIQGMPGFDDDLQFGNDRPRRKTPTPVKGEKLTAIQNADRWKNRRRMAYMALFGVFIVTGLILFVVDESRLAILADMVSWFYITMASIIGGYIGFSAWDNVRGGR